MSECCPHCHRLNERCECPRCDSCSRSISLCDCLKQAQPLDRMGTTFVGGTKVVLTWSPVHDLEALPPDILFTPIQVSIVLPMLAETPPEKELREAATAARRWSLLIEGHTPGTSLSGLYKPSYPYVLKGTRRDRLNAINAVVTLFVRSHWLYKQNVESAAHYVASLSSLSESERALFSVDERAEQENLLRESICTVERADSKVYNLFRSLALEVLGAYEQDRGAAAETIDAAVGRLQSGEEIWPPDDPRFTDGGPVLFDRLKNQEKYQRKASKK